MVGEKHRLGTLQVGIARHNHILVAAGKVNQRPLHAPQSFN
jgi:hypothetical protein